MPILLQINVTANWGSTGKIAESIGLAAINHGWESFIAYGRDMNPSQSKLIKVGSQFDVYVHYAQQRLLDNEGLASRLATKRLIRQIQQLKPAIIQLHNIHDHYLNYKLLFEYLNSTDIKVVWTFHDCWAFTGHCFHFVTIGCERWKEVCFNCPTNKQSVLPICDRSRQNFKLKRALFVGCKNLTIVPCSEWMANFVRESIFKEKRIQVILNGVDINVFKPSTPKDESGFEILAVSNVWHEKKGLYDLFKLRELLSASYKMTIVGLTRAQIQTLPKGIMGIERTQNVAELVSLYSRAHVFVNPTYADTFPTVNLEALACGTPVVTYQTGGSPEAVDEQTGMVIPQGDVKALANAIQQVQKHPFSSDACRKRAEEHFDKDKCFDKYIQLYEELLKTKELNN